MKNLLIKNLCVTALLVLISYNSMAESLNQAAWVSGTETYEFGHNSIANMQISDAPDDTDYSRSAMLHDGDTYRLYFFKKDSDDTLYQFGWNGSSYKFGHNSVPVLTITGKPYDASTSRFTMLHDGNTYRLYLQSKTNAKQLYQFGWDGSTYDFGYNSIPVLEVTNGPEDTDYSRFAMLHDGSTFRLYFAKSNTVDKLYQFAWDGGTYEFGHNSIPTLDFELIPVTSRLNSFQMLHDGYDYRFYNIAP